LRPLYQRNDEEVTRRMKQEMAEVKPNPNPTAIANAMSISANDAYRACEEELLAGKTTIDMILQASSWRVEAALALSMLPADRIRALDQHWRRTLLIERLLEQRYSSSRVSYPALMEVRWARLDAQVALEQAKVRNSK